MGKIALKFIGLCTALVLALTLVACGGGSGTYATGPQTAQGGYDTSGQNNNFDTPNVSSNETSDVANGTRAGALDLMEKSNYFFILNGNRFYLWDITVGDFDSLEEATVVTTFGVPGNPVWELEARASVDNLFIATEYGHFRVGAHNPYDWVIPIEEAVVDSVSAVPAGRLASEHLGHLPAEIEFPGGLIPGTSTMEEVEELLGEFAYPIGLRTHAFSACGANSLIAIRRNRAGRGFTINLDGEYVSNRMSMSFYPEDSN